jgi:RNA polymerase sigma-70 factor (ECF subfamily)
MGLTADPATAAELVQDSFVRAWEHLPHFRGECAFSTWLHRIAVNQHLMNERSGRRRARRVSLMTDLPDPLENGTESTATSAPGPSSDPALRMDIEQAIARLPEGARTVFVLREVAGYSHAEIAAQLGIAEGTSKAHLFRARRLLQAFLQP